MEKNVIHAELEEEDGCPVVHVMADGDGMTLLEMTANIAADLIKSNMGDKDVIERRKKYYIGLIEDAVNGDKKPETFAENHDGN